MPPASENAAGSAAPTSSAPPASAPTGDPPAAAGTPAAKPRFVNGNVFDDPGILFDYGTWCGQGNTGTKYSKCKQACAVPARGFFPDSQVYPSAECLRLCPTGDALDRLCARHDTCLNRESVVVGNALPFASPNIIPCMNHSCFCDRQLVDGAAALTNAECPLFGTNIPGESTSCGAYKAGLISLFVRAQAPTCF